MTDLSTAVSVNAFNSLSVSMSDLTNLVKDMALRMGPAMSAPTPSPAAPLTTMPAEFVPPIMAAAANSTSLTAPTSLHACFPNVEAAVIMAIIMHKFKVTDCQVLLMTGAQYTGESLLGGHDVLCL
ncbi:hypothetical protein C0989_012323 [Termitomyces sp. Mn162]|nr:hypothetical protein C0989_012323 [Termitomyces sp. Mn162]